MTGFLNLTKSKRGAIALIVIGLAYSLVLLGYLTGPAWADFTKWVVVTVIVMHTASGAIEKKASATSVASPTGGPS